MKRLINNVVKSLVVSLVMLVGCFIALSSEASAEVVESKVTDVNGDLVCCMLGSDYYEFLDNEGYYNVGDDVILDVQVDNDGEIEVVNADKVFNITSYEFKEDGSQITNYNDGSFAYINNVTGEYEFTPCMFLGDWNYSCKDINDLNNLISDYKKAHDGLFHSSLIKNYGEIIETESFKDEYDNSIIMYNDGSYVVINELNNVYEFYPVITSNNNGVWCLRLDNEKDLNNCFNTYCSIIEDKQF